MRGVLKTFLLLGFGISVVMFVYGFTSPDDLWMTGPAEGTDYHLIQHSGPYRVVIQTAGNWTMVIEHSFWYGGGYQVIYRGNGTGNAAIKIDVPTRGYLRIYINHADLLVLQRITPAYQWDYIVHGAVGIAVFAPSFVWGVRRL